VGVDLSQLEPFGRDIGFGYLDRTLHSPRENHPHLILNSDTDSMLRALRHELRHASAFTFSVAFVSARAIALLKQELIDFQGVGRIITSNYLNFNTPHAFAELLNLRQLGIDVRLHPDPAFHPKGYVFQRTDGVTAILGSSNLTAAAIARNHEWNLRVSASPASDLFAQFTSLVDQQLLESVPLTQSWIDAYAEGYIPPARRTRPIAPAEPSALPAPEELILPDTMQDAALAAIAAVKGSGKDRALIISATGTGKTILAALEVRSSAPKRLLFIAHREQILDRAMAEFRRVLDLPEEHFGKLAGSTRQEDRPYVFATIQTLSQTPVLHGFDPKDFDYLIVDEVHRAGAASFDKVLAHFRPAFLLGMTATPERTDDVNIFELFDYNVPYEIRLKSALELDMLAPFHYYGVADLTFEDGLSTSELTPLTRLVDADRVEHVLHALDLYTQSGIAPRGLIFCSRKEEAHELSRQLNARTLRGRQLRTVALTGSDSIEQRERTVGLLEAGDLDYVLTVDIFNEGVDIPSVNQVVMLRQTQSSIVFVQQLGRGLRKSPGKEYLVVIDFIGNYANNYLIPIALFGDESLNKESLRKNLIAAEEVGVLAGLSSIRFDRIAQDRVLRSLAEARLDSYHNLKSAIETVQRRVGRTPMLVDFLRFESVDPVLLATRRDNYPELLAFLFKSNSGLTPDESGYLKLVSGELLTAKRANELILLRELLSLGSVRLDAIPAIFYGGRTAADEGTVRSAIRSLTLEFNTTTERSKYPGPIAAVTGETVELVPELAHAYESSSIFRRHLDDAVEAGIALIAERYTAMTPFTPGLQYSRKDASRLLNWSSNMYSTIYGYRVDAATHTCPIFVTLHKSGEISATTAYEDALVDPNNFLWFTKSKRTTASPDVRPIIENSVELHVFVKKDDAEGSDFYYLGLARSSDAEQTSMTGSAGEPVPVVRMNLRFDQPVSAALYDYFHAVTE
jgi:superfamily II DNA or RNA helicase/HKD family nuclease